MKSIARDHAQPTTTRGAVFLDLHGTLGDQGAHGIEFTLYPFAVDALRLLTRTRLLAIVVTNQSRIGRDELSLAQFEAFAVGLRREMGAMGAVINAIYHCPHTADDGCDCRKPRAGLLWRARDEFGLDLGKCYLVGDNGAFDVVAARAVGCQAVLVRTGWGEGSLGLYRSLWSEVEPDYVAADVLDAARWIIAGQSTTAGLSHVR